VAFVAVVFLKNVQNNLDSRLGSSSHLNRQAGTAIALSMGGKVGI
jgi:hypothetical protein